MKRLLLFISIMVCQLSLCQAQVKYVPEYVIEGTTGQQIVYDPAGTLLENDTNIKCVVYVMRNYWWEAVDVAVSQQEGKWIGRFDVPKDAVLLCAKMVAGDKTTSKTRRAHAWDGPCSAPPTRGSTFPA